MKRRHSLPLILALMISGCAPSYAPFTDEVRMTRNLTDCVFHIAVDTEFRSVGILEPLDDKGPFKKDGHRYLRVSTADQGRAVAQGEDWITVDFGTGIVLRFQRAGPGNSYVMPGWGTITIQEERYDIQIGVLSGTDIELLWEPLPAD